jgi:hypothetical protein
MKTCTRRWIGAGVLAAAVISALVLSWSGAWQGPLLESHTRSSGPWTVTIAIYEARGPLWVNIVLLGAAGLGVLLLLLLGREKTGASPRRGADLGQPFRSLRIYASATVGARRARWPSSSERMDIWETLLIATVALVLFLGRQMWDAGREAATRSESARAIQRAFLAILAFVLLGVLYAVSGLHR